VTERRRRTILSNIRCALHSQGLAIDRIATLGDADAIEALQYFLDGLAHVSLTARSLQQDFMELAAAAAEAGVEDEES